MTEIDESCRSRPSTTARAGGRARARASSTDVGAEPEPVVGEDTDEPRATRSRAGRPPSRPRVIEDSPPTSSVEHVRGEIDVPDGYTVLEGTPLGNRRSVGVVVSRFNGGVTNRMLARALDALIEAGVVAGRDHRLPVPGAFELPLAAMALAKTRRYACIVALGAIVRGETPHFDYVAAECASGLQLAGIETGVPVAFGVLTVDNVAQAEARIQKAADAVRSALEMADLFARLGQRRVARYTAARHVQDLRISAGRSRRSATTAPTRWSPRSAASTRTCSASGCSLNGSPKRAYVCTRCLKGGKVIKGRLSNQLRRR